MRKVDLSKPSYGSWMTIGSSTVAEIMAQAGFDWLVVDMEHSVISLERAQEMIQVIEANNVIPLVRLSSNDPVQIARLMDAGSYGVLVPRVNTRADAEKAVSAVKYPPIGNRGVGLARAQKYGQGFDEYREEINEQSTVIVQIEHIDAVNNLREILSVPGVDGLFVGPYDLAASLGIPGDFANPKMVDAVKRIHAISEQLNKAAGIHIIRPDKAELKKRLEEGFRFIALSFDSMYLGYGCRDMLR